MKLPEKVDRQTYWTWMVLLVIGHLALGLAAAAGVPGMGGADTVAVIAIAVLLARRFRAVGWRPWIGGSFVIVTMVGVPLAVTGYAIAKNLPMSAFMSLMNPVGFVAGGANLALLVVAGYMPDIATADIVPVEAGTDGLLPVDTGSSPAPVVETGGPNVFAVSAAVVLIVVICGIAISLLPPKSDTSRTPVAVPQAPMPAVIPQAQTAAPNVAPPARQRTESNGLTKETNDFLRQFSQQRR